MGGQLPLPVTKVCGGCGVEKSTGDFNASKRGLASYCRPCQRECHRAWREKNKEYERERKRAWVEANKERSQEYSRAWRETNKDALRERKRAYYEANKSKANERSQAWYEDNRDRQSARNAEKYKANRENALEKQRAYHKANPERARAAWATRRARKLSAATVAFMPEQLTQRWAYYGNKCWICRGEAEATDHVKPLSKGGAHMLCNLRPICAPCNATKHAKWPYTKAA